jgi:repressor LexA
VLKVKGESMVDEQVREGDYVIVENRAEARNGEMVVALLDGENATLKKFYREKDEIRLQPAHPTMKPIYVEEGDLKIQGVVIGLLRKY